MKEKLSSEEIERRSKEREGNRRFNDRRESRSNMINKILAVISSGLVVLLTMILMLFFLCSLSIQNLNVTKGIVSELNVSIQYWISQQISHPQNLEVKTRIDTLFPLAREQMASYDIWDYPDSLLTLEDHLDEMEVLWAELQEEAQGPRAEGWTDDKLLALGSRSYSEGGTLNDVISFIFEGRSSDLDQLQNAGVLVMFLFLGVASFQFFESLAERRKRRLYQTIAYVDTATGVFNRTRCEILLAETVEAEHSAHLILFDLNDLKKVNDTLGHIAGDTLILDFATALRDGGNIFTPVPFVGRYGGDEFVVFFKEKEDGDVRAYLEKVAELIAEKNATLTDYQVSYATGIASNLTFPKAQTVSDLLKEADPLMYENKLQMKAERLAPTSE
ncbi:MAG: GGDEF domain-containing protein [Eubacteriales bacterium]